MILRGVPIHRGRQIGVAGLGRRLLCAAESGRKERGAYEKPDERIFASHNLLRLKKSARC